MDIKEIQNLIKFVSKSEVSEVSIKNGDFEIKIKTLQNKSDYISQNLNNFISQDYNNRYNPTHQNNFNSQEILTNNNPINPIKESINKKNEEENFIAIKSPMIGTFYRASNPNSEAYVKIGDVIEPGKVICIVEAMKLFNEIESEISGKIVKILVEDASPVEYDQPLFLVDPN